MPKSLFEHLSPDTGPKRILALDGGGVKGIFTLGMLKALEDELRRRSGAGDAFRLADYYDLIGGTSTGAIIATALALGMSVEEIIALYLRLGPDVFGRTAGDGVFLQSKFESKKLRRALYPVLTTKTLGSQDLRTGLAIHAKRIDTGSAWVVTNHPLGVFYDPAEDAGVFPNKRYRLIDLVLASAAAPTFFDEIVIDIAYDEKRRPIQKGYFVDGAVSAGEKQLLTIARAFLADPTILILDEATSALDSESEVAIQKALHELMVGKTVIAIAHRLSTLREMDRIIVLDNGRIAEDGTHDTLKDANGIYAKLWSHQAGGFIEG